MKTIGRITVFLILIGLVGFGCSDRGVDAKRIEDIRNLVRIHKDTLFTNTSIESLLTNAIVSGIYIHNPIIRDYQKPSYRLVPRDVQTGTTKSLDEASRTLVIEESENVKDDAYIVKGYADGHVSIEPRIKPD